MVVCPEHLTGISFIIAKELMKRVSRKVKVCVQISPAPQRWETCEGKEEVLEISTSTNSCIRKNTTKVYCQKPSKYARSSSRAKCHVKWIFLGLITSFCHSDINLPCYSVSLLESS